MDGTPKRLRSSRKKSSIQPVNADVHHATTGSPHPPWSPWYGGGRTPVPGSDTQVASRPEYSQERLRRIGVGIQVLGAELFAVSQAADPHPAPLQVVDVAHGVQPHRPGSQQLLALGFRVAARQLMDSGAADIDVAVGLGRRSPSPSIWCLLRYTFVTHTWTS